MEVTVRELAPLVDSLVALLAWLTLGWLILRPRRTALPEPPPAPSIKPLSDGERPRYAVRLAMRFEKWVHRRVETFEFLDAETVRRRMSVDFTLPEHRAIEEGETVFVPLMIIEKRDLRNLDVRDRDKTRLNVLTREQSSAIALSGLEALLGSGEEAAVPREQLVQIIEGPASSAGRLAESISIDEERMLAVWEASGASPEAVRILSATIKALLEDLAIGFMLLVPISYRPDQRRLIKFSFDAEMRHPKLRQIQRWGRAGAYRWATRILSSFGLVGRQEEFDDLSPGWTESYHAELLPPAGTYATDTKLTITTTESDEPLVSTDDNHWRPHVRAPQEGRTRNPADSGVLTTRFQARRDGLVFPLFLGAAIITGVLAYVPEQAKHLDGVTLGALLLAPFALSLYYARSDENSYVTNAMRGMRFIGTVPVVAGVLVIGLVALGYLGRSPAENPHWAITLTLWAGRISAGATVVLLMALLTPGLGWFVRSCEELLPKSRLAQGIQGGAAVLAWLAVVIALYGALARLLPI